MLVVSATREAEQEGHKFKASLGYRRNTRPTWVT